MVILHNLRKKINLDEYVDEKKSYLNCYKGATDENFIEEFKKYLIGLSRKKQKNASYLIEILISFSHEYGDGWENDLELKKKIEEYFNLAEKFLRKYYGDNIICRMDHFDETTPHSHFLIVPICLNKEGKKRFSSSEFLGGRKGMFDLHDQFFKEVGINYGLERGVRDSRTSHSDLKNYKEWEKSQKALLKQKESEIDEKKSEIEEKESALKKQQEEIDKNNEMIKKQQDLLFNLNGETMKKLANLSNRELEIEEIEKNLNEQIPQIPIPPVTFTENSRIKWRDEIQNVVNVAFKKIKDTLISLKISYDNLLNKCNTLKTQNDKYKKRAEKAEKDLLEMPIEEISAARELRKKNEANQTDNQKKGSKSHVKK
jgi:hypothetical protein